MRCTTTSGRSRGVTRSGSSSSCTRCQSDGSTDMRVGRHDAYLACGPPPSLSINEGRMVGVSSPGGPSWDSGPGLPAEEALGNAIVHAERLDLVEVLREDRGPFVGGQLVLVEHARVRVDGCREA